MTEPAPLPMIVRDYLYVDIARVRSLLAQIANGAPDVVTERSARVRELYAGLTLGPVSAGARQNRNVESEETRSLTDVHFALFEESAEAVGLLSDISDQVQDEGAWRSGAVEASLAEGRLVRLTAPVRLVDPAYFQDSLSRVDTMIEAFLPLTEAMSGSSVTAPAAQSRATGKGPGPKNRPAQRGSAALAQRKRELMGGLPPEALIKLGEFVGSLLAGGISMRCMPCGDQAPDCAFSGTLLDRSTYIEPEREAIFARFGPGAAYWTLVALVTRFGNRDAPPDLNMPSDFQEGASRLAAEELVVRMLAMLERMGTADAPTWPTIAVTPLALYRLVVPSNGGDRGSTAGSQVGSVSHPGGILPR